MPNPVGMPRGRDPLQAQNYKTQRADLPEDLWQPLYDRANIVATAGGNIGNPILFFTTPRGQSATLITGGAAPAAKVKTFRDTNLDTAGVVPTKLFKFVGISFAYIHRQHGGTAASTAASNAADRQLIAENGWLEFWIVDKPLLYLPLINVPALNPIVAAASTMNNTPIMVDAPGGGQSQGMYKLPINITLNPYENFRIQLSFDGTVATTNEVDVQVYLQGFMRRPS